MLETFHSEYESETEEIACYLARENLIKPGDIIALSGDLGAGKTAFTRGLVRFFSPDSRVTSPTFSIVNEYKGKIVRIFHFDMYRINTEDDLLSIGFYDYLDNMQDKIIIIEWFEKIADFFDEQTVEIEIVKSEEHVCERKIIYERVNWDINNADTRN